MADATRADPKSPAPLIGVGAALAAFAYFYAFRRLGWFMEDEGVLYYHYLRTYQGQLPYRDFYTGYAPLGYYLHAWFFAVAGVSIVHTRVLMGALHSLTVLGLYLVTRRFVHRAGAALLPSLLFAVLQPGDILDMAYHNSPYPSWYAVSLTVWTAWAMLRCLEADAAVSLATSQPVRPILWLLAVGVLAGLTFLLKQNAGVFLLWAASAYLVAAPPVDASAGPEPRWSRLLRGGYLLLLPLASLILVRSFPGPATLALFVVPLLLPALAGALEPGPPVRWGELVLRLAAIGLAFALTVTPWIVYFALGMGLGPFLRHLFFVGTDVDRNAYVPFPAPLAPTVAIAALLTAYVVLRERAARAIGAAGRPHGRLSLLVAALAFVALGAGALYQEKVLRWVRALLPGEGGFDVAVIYFFSAIVSDVLDNTIAYLCAIALWVAGLLVLRAALRRRWGEEAAARPAAPRRPLLVVVWFAACCFLLYYPRMDAAHLFTAAQLVYVLGVALLARWSEALPPARLRGQRLWHAAAATLLVVLVSVKLLPKISGFVVVEDNERIGHFVKARFRENLRFPRADLFFPAGEDYRHFMVDLRDLIQYLRDTTRPDEPIFAYPTMPMFYLLAERDNPTRHDYIFGSNTTYPEQLRLIRRLEETKVRTLVLPNSPGNYFFLKARDYTRPLVAYLEHQYYVERRFGPYDVLRRYGAEDGRRRPSAPAGK